MPTTEDPPNTCPICKIGRINRQMTPLAFRHLTDKGMVHCEVTVLVGTCDRCGAKSTEPGVDKTFAEAIRKEYDKLK
jgi:hypothetical protein